MKNLFIKLIIVLGLTLSAFTLSEVAQARWGFWPGLGVGLGVGYAVGAYGGGGYYGGGYYPYHSGYYSRYHYGSPGYYGRGYRHGGYYGRGYGYGNGCCQNNYQHRCCGIF